MISRRAGGLSIGINLNPNNACNWRCIYCQVPDLQRGSAPPVDLDLLEQELRYLLVDVLQGTFYSRFNLRPQHRRIRDIAISGNGEPTSANMFDRVIELIGHITDELQLPGNIRPVLITNGSFMQRAVVQKGIQHLSELNGEIWFKLDSATSTGINTVNNTSISISRVRKNLEIAAKLCPTWIQTCVFGMDGEPPCEAEQKAYIQFLDSILAQGIRLRGVLLYGIARPSRQPETPRLSRLSGEWLEQYAQKISKSGIKVKTSV